MTTTYTIPFLGQLDLLQTCLGIFLMDSNQVIRIEVGCSLTMCSGTGGGMLEDRTIVELKIHGYYSRCPQSITANTQWDLMEKE